MNSCSFDTNHTTVFNVYLNLDGSAREIVGSSIRGGHIYAQLADGTMDIIQAKEALLPLVYHSGSRFVLGKYYTLPDIWHKLVDDIHDGDVSPGRSGAFSFSTRLRKACANELCPQYGVVVDSVSSHNTLALPRVSNSDRRPFLSVQEMYDMNVSEIMRTYVCRECKLPMHCERNGCDFPIIMYVEIDIMDGDNFSIDTTVFLRTHGEEVHTYDIAAIMYYGCDHFMSRFVGSDGHVYEYDGMKRNGMCVKLDGSQRDSFAPCIMDSSDKPRKAKVLLYKKRLVNSKI
jgi:hypothetical protein